MEKIKLKNIIFIAMIGILSFFGITKFNTVYADDNPQTLASNIIDDNNTILPSSISNIKSNPIYILKEAQVENEDSYICNYNNHNWCYIDENNVYSFSNFLDYVIEKKVNSGEFSVNPNTSYSHIKYAMSQDMFNTENPYGFNKTVDDIETFSMLMNYLTLNLGPVLNDDFNESNFDINYDIDEFLEIEPYATTGNILFCGKSFISDDEEYNSYIKTLLKEKGSIYTSMHSGVYYNAEKGYYIDDSINPDTFSINSNVSTMYKTTNGEEVLTYGAIIGWDDSYSKENFKDGFRPENDGAWIVQTGIGATSAYSYNSIKRYLYYKNYDEYISQGIESFQDVSNSDVDTFVNQNDLLETVDYVESASLIYSSFPNNGLFYVSYEDTSILNNAISITDIEEYSKDYDNLYYYDEQYCNQYVDNINPIDQSVATTATVFNKKTDEDEYITKIGLTLLQPCEVSIYINPKNNNKDGSYVRHRKLTTGDSCICQAGYNIIELENPIKVSDEFVVEVEMTTLDGSDCIIAVSTPYSGNTYDNFGQVEEGKCFLMGYSIVSSLTSTWQDLSTILTALSPNTGADTTTRVYTTNTIEKKNIKEFQIVTKPKTLYYTGQDFSTSGLLVKVIYEDNTEELIYNEDITFENTKNLQPEQTSILCMWEESRFEIQIEVYDLVDYTISSMPYRTHYAVGEDFDSTGLKITVIDEVGNEYTLTDYTYKSNTQNLQLDQNQIIIEVNNLEVIIPISVYEVQGDIEKILIEKNPDKTVYVAGENFDITGIEAYAVYEDGTKIKIDPTQIDIINGNNLGEATSKISIVYMGCKTQINITVDHIGEAGVEDLEIFSEPEKTLYYEGEIFDPTGLVIEAMYSQGIQTGVAILLFHAFDYDKTPLIAGQEYITITLRANGLTIDIPIEVLPLEVESIRVSKSPEKLTYYVGEDFDKTGLEVLATYNSGKEEDITNNIIILDGTNLYLGQTKVTIKYGVLTQQIPITVNKNYEEVTVYNSDFSAQTLTCPSADVYVNQQYAIYTVEITNLVRDLNNMFEYYYYISNSNADTTMTDDDWIKISQSQKKTDKISFKINTTDLNEDFDMNLVWYVYVKEVAKVGDVSSTYITKAMFLAEPEQVNKYENDTDNPDEDLPYAGVSTAIAIPVICAMGVSIFGYIRYRHMKNKLR